MNKWISTKERFPTVGELVVIHIPQYNLTLAGEKASREGWWTEEEGVHFLNDSDIDYWLPIPELPRENESEIKLIKRTPEEREAYKQGYIAGMKSAQEITRRSLSEHLKATEEIYRFEEE